MVLRNLGSKNVGSPIILPFFLEDRKNKKKLRTGFFDRVIRYAEEVDNGEDRPFCFPEPNTFQPNQLWARFKGTGALRAVRFFLSLAGASP